LTCNALLIAKPALLTNPFLQSWLQAEIWGNTLSSYPSTGAWLPCYSCSASPLRGGCVFIPCFAWRSLLPGGFQDHWGFETWTWLEEGGLGWAFWFSGVLSAPTSS